MADPRGENRSYSGYGNKSTGAGSYSNKSGNGVGATSSGSDDKRQKKQGIQVALGNAYYDKNGAYVVLKKPATVTKSSAVTTPVASANIIQTQNSGSASYNSGPTKVPSYSQGDGQMSPALAARQNNASSKKAATSTPLSLSTGGTSDNISSTQPKTLRSVAPTNLAARNYGKFDNSTYQAIAESNKNSTMPSMLLSAIKNDKYRNDEVSYNQAYWAGLRSGNTSQADMKAKQDAIGMKKSYSGDRVITPDMQRRASDDLSRVTGSMAVLDDPKMTAEKRADLIKSGILVGGVTKNVGDPYGFFNERQDTTYNYKGGPSIVTRANDPSLFGVGLGAKTSTTFVDGVAVAEKTGGDGLGNGAGLEFLTVPEGINDTTTVDPVVDPVVDPNSLDSINKAIAETTDPEELKSLYQRRLSLMRMDRTRTRFAGLLDDADTKKSQMSIV